MNSAQATRTTAMIARMADLMRKQEAAKRASTDFGSDAWQHQTSVMDFQGQPIHKNNMFFGIRNQFPMYHDEEMDGHVLGALAMMCTVWWITTWFTYIKNHQGLEFYGVHPYTVPLGWFWSKLGHADYGWTALSYFAFFVVYGIVSLVEVISYLAWQLFDNYAFASFWFLRIGYWGTILGFFIPWIFALLQISTLGWNTNQDFGANASFLLSMGVIIHVVASYIHIVYVPPFVNYLDKKTNTCRCSKSLKENASEQEKTNYLVGCFREQISQGCPFEKARCPLPRYKSKTEEDFRSACLALAVPVKEPVIIIHEDKHVDVHEDDCAIDGTCAASDF